MNNTYKLERMHRVFFVIFALLFLAAPFYYQPNLGGESLSLPYNSTIWIVAGLLIAIASFIVYQTEQLVLPRHWFWLMLLPLGAFFTSLIADNNNPIEWSIRISVITGGYVFFISLFQFRLTPRMIEQSLYLIVLMGIIMALYGIIQKTGIVSLSFIPNANGAAGQAIGVFQQVNLQGSMMTTLLVLVYYLITRPDLSKFSALIKITLCTIGALVASYSITVSGSRTALLGTGLAILLLFFGRWQLFKSVKLLLSVMIAATILGVVLGGTTGLSATSDKFDRAMGGVDADIRWKVYRVSWELYKESPWVGHGLGSFQKVFQDKRVVHREPDKLNMGNVPRFTHPHNELIFWLVEGGSIAIIGILLAAIAILMQLIKIGRQRGMGYAALLLPIVLHTQTELPFYISNTHWLLLLFLLFITYQHGKKTKSIASLSTAAKGTIPVFFSISSMLTSVVMMQALLGNAGVINFLKTKRQQMQHLQPALNSGYFRQGAYYQILRREMLTGIEQNKLQATVSFVVWAENRLRVSPARSYYIDLVLAYDVLGKKDKRDKTLDTLIAMYGHTPELDKLQKDLQQAGLETSITNSVSAAEIQSSSVSEQSSN